MITSALSSNPVASSVPLFAGPVDDPFTKDNDDKINFQKHKPFVTLLMMSFGPLATVLSTTLIDFLELYLFTIKYQNKDCVQPVQLLGFASFVAGFITLLLMFFSHAIVSRLSGLLGENRPLEASQLFSDIFRIGLITIIVIVPFFQYLVYPLLSFMNCPEYIRQTCYLYVTVIISGSIPTFFFHLSCSFLQAIGKPILNGVLHIIDALIHSLVLVPLLLFTFNADISLIGLPITISESVIGLSLFLLIYSNRFGYDISISHMLEPFTRETLTALKLSLPLFMTFICNITPPLCIMKFLLSTAKSPEESASFAGIHTIFGKAAMLTGSVPIAIGNGLLTAGSFAYGSRDSSRLMKLFFGAIIISMSIQLFFTFVMIFKPQLIADLYLSEDTDITLCNKVLKIPFYTNWLSSINICIQMFLICIGKPLLSTVPSFLQTIFLVVLGYVFSKIFKENPERIYFAYNINDIAMLLISISILISPLMRLIKEKKVDDSTTLLTEVNPQDF